MSRIIRTTLIAGALGLVSAFAVPAAASAPAQAVPVRTAASDGPCWFSLLAGGSGGLGGGGRSECPPGTYRHQHRAIVLCHTFGRSWYEYGNWASGASVSEAWCPVIAIRDSGFNQQMPDD